MELSSVFNFEKSNVALAKLETLLICKKCNKYCSNPRRHSECGNLLCECSSKTETCLYCGGRYSQTNTSPDWHVNTIIEATKTIKSLISPKQFTTTESKDNEMEKCTSGKISNTSFAANDLIASSTGMQNIQVPFQDCRIPNSKASDKNSQKALIIPIETKKSSVQDKRYSGKQSKVIKNKEALLYDTKTDRHTELKDVSATIKTIMKRNANGETKLHSACVKGDTRKVEEYLAAGADPCTKDNVGWTPLHDAVSKGHINIVKLLLEAGVMVNVPGGYNNTPLHDAALGNHLETAQLLMNFGANPEARNIEGYTPRSMAQTKEMELILRDYNPSSVVSKSIKHQRYQKDLVLYGFDLSAKEVKEMNVFVQRYKLRKVSSYSSDVTHIIVADSGRRCTPAIDILHGILKGRWIIDSEWLHCNLNTTKICDPYEYEVIGTIKFPDSFAPQRSRENAEKMQPSIFNGCHFYFSGIDKVTVGDLKFTKSQLSSLILSGDGLVLTREPNPEAIPAHERTVPYHADNSILDKCSHFIIYQPGRHEPLLKYNMPHVKSLPVSWLLDCIETFRLIEP